MTRKFIPDITVFLGPPADPELRARFEKAQRSPVGTSGAEERWLQLEPRLPVLLEKRDGHSGAEADGRSLRRQGWGRRPRSRDAKAADDDSTV